MKEDVDMEQTHDVHHGAGLSNECDVDMSGMRSFDSIVGDSAEDTALLRGMATEAKEFLSRNDWCKSIEQLHFAYGIGGVIGVFLFKIVPNSPDVDKCLWVIVGDLPPAYIVTEDNPRAADAIEAYCSEMEAWVEAVEMGESVEELIPVNVPATADFANQLKGRIEFLRDEVVPLSQKHS
ncbi:MAG TPA: DUF4826 family protein [Acidobacteriaceae bacterium]|jgi:hypothetical protein|nr:DUF4826 family protein [Acidobacteriaceae bacterium]